MYVGAMLYNTWGTFVQILFPMEMKVTVHEIFKWIAKMMIYISSMNH